MTFPLPETAAASCRLASASIPQRPIGPTSPLWDRLGHNVGLSELVNPVPDVPGPPVLDADASTSPVGRLVAGVVRNAAGRFAGHRPGREAPVLLRRTPAKWAPA